MKLLVFIFFLIIFSIAKFFTSAGKATIDIAKAAYEIVNVPETKIKTSTLLVREINGLLEVIEENFEQAYCKNSPKTYEERSFIFLEVIIFYRIIVSIILKEILASENKDFSTNFHLHFIRLYDSCVEQHIESYSEYFSIETYYKYLNIREPAYNVYLQNLMKDITNNRLMIFYKQAFTFLQVINCLHVYMISKNGTLPEDNNVFINMIDLMKESGYNDFCTKYKASKMLVMQEKTRETIINCLQTINNYSFR